MPFETRKQVYTGVITASGSDIVLNIDENDNISNLSVVCTSTTPILIKGTVQLDGHASTDLPLEKGERFSFAERVLIGSFTITIPDGASAKIIAFK